MKRLKYCPTTYRLLGPTSDTTDPHVVEVEDDLFVRIVFDMSAFYYNPLSNLVEIKPDFEHQPLDEPKALDLESYFKGLMEFTYVPEIDASVTLDGPLGRALLFAISSSIFLPQKIYVKTSSSYEIIEVTEEVAGQICAALKDKIESTLGDTNE